MMVKEAIDRWYNSDVQTYIDGMAASKAIYYRPTIFTHRDTSSEKDCSVILEGISLTKFIRDRGFVKLIADCTAVTLYYVIRMSEGEAELSDTIYGVFLFYMRGKEGLIAVRGFRLPKNGDFIITPMSETEQQILSQEISKTYSPFRCVECQHKCNEYMEVSFNCHSMKDERLQDCQNNATLDVIANIRGDESRAKKNHKKAQ